MSSANGKADQVLGIDLIATPTKTAALDDTAGGTVILAATAAPGLYEIETDADIYAKQVVVDTAITAAGSWLVTSAKGLIFQKYAGLEVRGIMASGTAAVEVRRLQTPQIQ